jgi:trehalose synthase
VIKVTSDLWWKNTILYCLDVEMFSDADGDGCGDFAGLTERLDYLAGLGVTCVWLMPFYPTANRDDGYDIIDFYNVDPSLGTLGDFVEFVRTARDRGIRVIADLVVNHTSVQHPWFQEARRNPDSRYRDFYVWQDHEPSGPNDLVFPGEETSNWSYDEQAGKWYLHRFYAEQPDLNITNPAVRDEIGKIIGFWIQQGLSGFRVDAVPFLVETAGEDPKKLPDPHEYLRDLRTFLNRRLGEAILLGEVNLPPKDLGEYFGGENGDELQMLFNFPANQAFYLSLARQHPDPLRGALQGLPPTPDDGQWATFVRNHDELSLDKLSEDERQEVFAAFGPDKDLQVYGRGLRRRLPPMLGGDQQPIRMVYSLLF